MAATAELIGRAFDMSADAIILTNTARRIVSANAAASQRLGYSIEAIQGLAVRTVYATDADWNQIETLMSSAAPLNRHYPVAVTLRHRDGELFDTAVTVTPLFGELGKLRGVMQTFRPGRVDTSADDGSNRSNDANQLRLARGIAHDFNNVLAIIAGNIQLVEAKVSAADVRQFLKEAGQACAMGAELTQRLTTFAADRRFLPVQIDVAALVRAQMPLLMRTVGGAITIQMTDANTARCVVADKSAFENALLNLVLNSRDAMPNGGAITISIEDEAGIASSPHDNVRISVTDTGTGMTPRVRDRAFDPFFSTKGPGRGAGLGLATVAGFANQSGGTTTLKSTIGKGTTVTIRLPAARPTNSKTT